MIWETLLDSKFCDCIIEPTKSKLEKRKGDIDIKDKKGDFIFSVPPTFTYVQIVTAFKLFKNAYEKGIEHGKVLGRKEAKRALKE